MTARKTHLLEVEAAVVQAAWVVELVDLLPSRHHLFLDLAPVCMTNRGKINLSDTSHRESKAANIMAYECGALPATRNYPANPWPLQQSQLAVGALCS